MLSILQNSLALLLVCFLSIPLRAQIQGRNTSDAVLFNTEPAALTLKIDLSRLEYSRSSGSSVEYSSCTIAGEPTTYDRGYPLLPAVSRFVIVPPEAGLTLETHYTRATRIHPDLPPALCDDPELILADIGVGEIYPPLMAELSDPVVVRGVRLVKLTLYPVQYDLQTGDYVVNEGLEARIRYTSDAPVNPVLFPDARRHGQEFRKYLRALAINGEDYLRDDPADDVDRLAGHYLVVVPSNALLWNVNFIEWRRKAGYQVDILTLTNNQAMSANTVRQQIQERYQAHLEAGTEPFEAILLIGERESYRGGQFPQNILQAEAGNSTFRGVDHADYKYALLEGDDQYPDVSIGRFPAGTQNLAALVTGRTLAYEATPNMDAPAWFTRSGVYFQHWGNDPNSAWHITIPTNVAWGEEILRRYGFNNVQVYENYNWDTNGDAIGPVLRNWLNQGCNLMIGRAENYYWRRNFNGVNRNTVFPINICISGHGEEVAYNMFRTGEGGNLKGPVAANFCWGNPPTATSSYLWLQLVNSILCDDMSMGWARNYAITSIERFFPNFNTPSNGQPCYLYAKTDIDLNGDPYLQPWLGVPRRLSADFPQTVSPQTRYLEVSVSDPANETPASGIRVTLYAPGNIPTNSADAYAGWNRIVHKSDLTDELGLAQFVMEEGVTFAAGSHLYLTVTGRDLCPIFSDIVVREQAADLAVTDWNAREIEGDGDGLLNPGETGELFVSLKNTGGGTALEDVTATAVSNSHWLTVDTLTVHFGDMAPDEELFGDAPFTFTVRPNAKDAVSHPGDRPSVILTLRSGEYEWTSSIRLSPSAADLSIQELWPARVLEAGQSELNIEIENRGGKASEPFRARLVSFGHGVSVDRAESTYPIIEPGEHSAEIGAPFLVTRSPYAIPGASYPLGAVIQGLNGFSDTLHFSLQTGEQEASAPFGPDPYGYLCYDNLDTSWQMCPYYDWIEVNPDDGDLQYDGTILEFSGQSLENMGETIVVPLGFSTRFYGELFDTISVCSNGFISLGSQPRITNFQNWPMNEGIGGGAGMIAPLWDDLSMGQNSRICFYLNADEHWAVVEWYRVLTTSGNREYSFEVVLYDHEFWPSETGDQDILFQYRTVSANPNIRNGDQQWLEDIPFASVGISSPDGTSGLSYAYNNNYPVAAAFLQNRRAILFSTTIVNRKGLLTGQVIDRRTWDPLIGVEIYTNHHQTAVTDSSGRFRIESAWADVPCIISAHAEGYVDTMTAEAVLLEDDSLDFEIQMRHEDTDVDRDVNPGLVSSVELYQNYPNPFNGTTQVDFSLPFRQQVVIRMFDLSGRQTGVATKGWFESGRHQIDVEMDEIPAGIYIIRLEAGGEIRSRKVALVK